MSQQHHQQPLLIKPPPAVRAVLEKTAGFVARNGRAFETRILSSDKGRTAKFAFLHATSPFHAYYEDRVRHYAEGGAEAAGGGGEEGGGKKEKKEKAEEGKGRGGGKEDDEKEGEKENATADAADTKSDATAAAAGQAAGQAAAVQRLRVQKASVPDPVARALLTQRNAIAEREKSRREALEALERAKRDAAPSAGNDANAAATGDVDLVGMEREVPTVVPPPPLVYTPLTAPSNLAAGRIEIIKLTAQYAALSSLAGGGGPGAGGGRSGFLRTLTEREWTNEAVFGFLQPRSAEFAYFAALVDVYRLILGRAAHGSSAGGGGSGGAGVNGNAKGRKGGGDEGSTATGDELLTELLSSASATANDPTAARSRALSVAAYRAEYERSAEERRWQAAAADGGIAGGGGGGGGVTGTALRIDWHDFVVVETIDFAMDEVVDTVAPRPKALFGDGSDAGKKNKNKEAKEEAAKVEADDDDDGDKKPAAEMEVGEENAEVRLARAQAALAATAGEDDDVDDDEPIQIDATYQAKVVSTTDSKQTTAATHVVDPISGKSVPVEHLSEHMRIQLLDPNWSKQRKTFLDKQRETNIVSGDAIAANISGFAKEKGELFGSSEQELLDREASKQRLVEANKLIREQAQQQQQPPQPAAALPNRPRPSGLEAAPAAKRARVDAPSAPGVGGAAVRPPLPPPPPPPQQTAAAPVAPVPAAPVVPPPPPPPGAPMAAPIAPPAPTGLVDTILAPEAFIASLSDPANVEVTVQTPADSTNASWNLDGRALSVRVDVTTGTVKTIKEACRSDLGGMPTNKMQLRMPGAGFLKDKDGLAVLNIGPGTTLDLVPKKRGGR